MDSLFEVGDINKINIFEKYITDKKLEKIKMDHIIRNYNLDVINYLLSRNYVFRGNLIKYLFDSEIYKSIYRIKHILIILLEIGATF